MNDDPATTPRLTLFSTSACSACESAIDLLLSMPELAGTSLDVVEVTERADWVERYGERVPVLVRSAAELGWPFDAAAVKQFLSAG